MDEFSPPFSEPPDGTITFWAVIIVEDIGGKCNHDIILFRNQCTHGKLSLFLKKTSNNSNATGHQTLFTISTRI